MNKYQEACKRLEDLNELNLNKLETLYGITSNEERLVMGQLNLLLIQELVDKETPMKPVPILNTHGHVKWYACNACSVEPIFKHERCKSNHCGQKQDWSDEE